MHRQYEVNDERRQFNRDVKWRQYRNSRRGGEDNFFLFGLTKAEIDANRGGYDSAAIIEQHEDLKQVIRLLELGHFNQFDPGIFDDLIVGSLKIRLISSND